MERVEGWELILANKLKETKNTPFEYGVQDCTIWAVGIISSYTNLKWKATWVNKRQALLQQKSHPMEEQASDILGMYNKNILNTRRGDLVQKDLGMDAALGICVGSMVAFLKEDKGICYKNLADCTYSWRI